MFFEKFIFRLLQHVVDNSAKLRGAVLPLHVAEHRVAARLNRDVEEGVDARMPQNRGNLLQVVKNVGRIGHAEAHLLCVTKQR